MIRIISGMICYFYILKNDFQNKKAKFDKNISKFQTTKQLKEPFFFWKAGITIFSIGYAPLNGITVNDIIKLMWSNWLRKTSRKPLSIKNYIYKQDIHLML